MQPNEVPHYEIMLESSLKRLPYFLSIFLSGSLSCNVSATDRNKEVKITSSVNEASVESLLDVDEPSSSSDYGISRLSFHPKKGSLEWVQYEFPKIKRIENISIYWFDEAQAAASFRNEIKEILPRAWKISFWQDGQWQAAKIKQTNLGIERDQYNLARLTKAVNTKKLKIEVQLNDELSAGILGCRINQTSLSKAEEIFTNPDRELKRIRAKASKTLALDVDV